MEQDSTKKFVHDLRNPINVISVNAELGKIALLKNQDVDRTLKTLEEILCQCQQCSKIIEDYVTANIEID